MKRRNREHGECHRLMQHRESDRRRGDERDDPEHGLRTDGHCEQDRAGARRTQPGGPSSRRASFKTGCTRVESRRALSNSQRITRFR